MIRERTRIAHLRIADQSSGLPVAGLGVDDHAISPAADAAL
jgi:hypothetical protein